MNLRPGMATAVKCAILCGLVAIGLGGVVTVIYRRALSDLLGPYPGSQSMAMWTFAMLGKPVVPLLLDQLELAEDSATRGRIGWTIEGILNRPRNRARKFLPHLERIANSGKYSLASPALGCIAKYKGDREARAVAGRIASHSPNASIRGRALGAFIVVAESDKSEIPFIKNFLNDQSRFVQIRAAYTLGRLGDKSGLPIVQDVLRSTGADNSTLRNQDEAAKAAGEIGDVHLVPALEAIRADSARATVWPDAHEAIALIQLKNTDGELAKIKFLVGKLEDKALSYWAGLHLRLIGTPAAEAALLKVADTPQHPGGNEAARWHSILQRERKSGVREF